MPDEPLLAPKSLNKGEWSELYVVFRLLSEGKLYAADENLDRIPNIFYPILEIIREEVKGAEYRYKTADTSADTIRIFLNGKCMAELSVHEFTQQADKLLSDLQKKQEGAFCIPDTEIFSSAVFISKVKAGSAQKADIHLKLHDIYTGYEPEVGFSIKSDLGRAPTLLNAGTTTNFVYRVSDLPEPMINAINGITTNNKIRDRVNSVTREGGTFHFSGPENEIFSDNLAMIDSNMDKIIASMLLKFYESELRNSSEVADYITAENPLKLHAGLARNFYRHKFKEFLCAIALGMRPGTHWDGLDEANGGYIIVKNDGDVVAYHIYNRNSFREYLLNNTKFETASSSRHNFGSLYKQNGEVFMNLNLQIRFL